jgi:hypothetical protein
MTKNKVHEPENTDITGSSLGTVSLTENQVKQAIVDFLYKDDEFKKLVNNKRIALVTEWQTSKWSKPNELVHLNIIDITS